MDNEIKVDISEVVMINEDPSVIFHFYNKVADMNPETALNLIEVELDGWNIGTLNNKQWQDIIDFCQKQIK